ncbi:MAG: hypothetical protein WCD86_00540 [Ktedonobacteraceae bacterium]
MIENMDREQQIARRAAPAKLVLPHFQWPTSRPGPKATPPPLGHKPLPGRTEQTVDNNFTPPQK